MPLYQVAPVAIGSLVISGTPGSVLFIDSTGNLNQNNANLFWDNSGINFGIGTNTPLRHLHISGDPGSGVGQGFRITNTRSGGGDFTFITTDDSNGEGGNKFLFINELVSYPDNNILTLSTIGAGLFNVNPRDSLHITGSERVDGSDFKDATGDIDDPNTNGNPINGTGTLFTTELGIGDYIYVPGEDTTATVLQINSDTEMIVDLELDASTEPYQVRRSPFKVNLQDGTRAFYVDPLGTTFSSDFVAGSMFKQNGNVSGSYVRLGNFTPNNPQLQTYVGTTKTFSFGGGTAKQTLYANASGLGVFFTTNLCFIGGDPAVTANNKLFIDTSANKVYVSNASFEAGVDGGSVSIGSTGGTLGFLGTTPITKPSGDVVTALSNFGLITSPTINTLSINNPLADQVFS